MALATNFNNYSNFKFESIIFILLLLVQAFGNPISPSPTAAADTETGLNGDGQSILLASPGTGTGTATGTTSPPPPPQPTPTTVIATATTTILATTTTTTTTATTQPLTIEPKQQILDILDGNWGKIPVTIHTNDTIEALISKRIVELLIPITLVALFVCFCGFMLCLCFASWIITFIRRRELRKRKERTRSRSNALLVPFAQEGSPSRTPVRATLPPIPVQEPERVVIDLKQEGGVTVHYQRLQEEPPSPAAGCEQTNAIATNGPGPGPAPPSNADSMNVEEKANAATPEPEPGRTATEAEFDTDKTAALDAKKRLEKEKKAEEKRIEKERKAEEKRIRKERKAEKKAAKAALKAERKKQGNKKEDPDAVICSIYDMLKET